MTRVKVGQSNLLTVIKESSFGYFFDGGEDGNILMPNRHKPDHKAYRTCHLSADRLRCSSISDGTWPLRRSRQQRCRDCRD